MLKLAELLQISIRRRECLVKYILYIDPCCPCCGFQIEKEELGLLCDPRDFKFLGSGFPLLYNWVKYCILILTVQFTFKGAFNLYTNLTGDYCSQLKVTESGRQTLEPNCPDSFLL